MRLSMDKNDPGYDPAAAIHAIIQFNGVTVDTRAGRYILTADEEAGAIAFYQVGPDGKLVVDELDPEHAPKLFHEAGSVKIVLRALSWDGGQQVPMQFVALRTRAAEFVSFAKVPAHFASPPQLLLWGERWFLRRGDDLVLIHQDNREMSVPDYVEADLMWVVQNPELIADLPPARVVKNG